VLPSGRPLCYPLPKLVDALTPWGEVKKAVEISTTNSYTRKWERRTLYGGLQTENVVQAVARDVMAEAMLRVEKAGYPVVLTVHDEILAEAETGSLDHFNELMSVTPEWAPELVVKVEGWEGERYRK
jgi:DNA polymerase